MVDLSELSIVGALVLCCMYAAGGSLAPNSSATIDVLLAFRKAITADPTQALSSWASNGSSNYCSWEGVLCHADTQHVKGIQLPGRQLQGSITPMLGQLSYLSYLNLSFNQLSGSVPAQLGGCSAMRQLSLNDNKLEGVLPPELANLTRLQVLSAGDNKLTGQLPPMALPALLHLNLSTNSLQGDWSTQLAGCASLRLLDLSYNHFQGSIPASVGNLSHLAFLDLSFNNFSSVTPFLANCTQLYHINLFTNIITGSIPASWFHDLHRLLYFSLGVNFFSGTVPPAISSLSGLQYIELGGNHFQGQFLHLVLNCSSLSVLDLWSNSFKESLPPELGSSLPHLTVLGLYNNSFYGPIPASLGNCSNITDLVLGNNYGLSGTVPKDLFRLHKVDKMDLQNNAFTGNLPAEIGNRSSVLTILLLNNNNFTGDLPPQLGLLQNLQGVTFEYNQFSGSIPDQLGNCTQLLHLLAFRNLLKGPIPSSLCKPGRLEYLQLDNNQLSGSIPSSLSNCTGLSILHLNNNLLKGGVLEATLTNMVEFDLSNNGLSGPIPPELGSMTHLQTLDLSFNNLSGSLPGSLASCVNLFYLNLSSNQLTGSIPPELGTSLESLLVLNLSRNSISGQIPQQLGDLTYLKMLDLSFNSLSGEIPDSLANLANLSFLNVSYNSLEGTVPNIGPFRFFTPASFVGNPRLCGTLLHIPCPSGKHSVLQISLIAAAGLMFLILLFSFVFFLKVRPLRQIRGQESSSGPAFLRLTLKEIQEATNGFTEDNIIGTGGTSVVYKGITRDGKTLAFKKLFLCRSSPGSPFFAEIKSLRQIRHRNLVKVLSYLESNDILILEYMPNGNLGDYLHPGSSSTSEGIAVPPWDHRLRIAKGIAEGLAYLHHDCPTAIIHLDVKPTNIMLDANMDARITDFGLARVMQEAASESFTQNNMKGSLGYVAPEYANLGKISRKCDVYSFGIVLMEIATGRSPTDDKFTEGETLAKWVQSCLLRDGQFQEYLVGLCTGTQDYSDEQRKEVTLLLNVAILCTKQDPKERPTMQNVVKMLR